MRAYHYLADGKTTKLVSLGKLSRSPFKLIWNAADVPNQLFTGLTLIADADLGNGQWITVRQEGIFLTPHPQEFPITIVQHTDDVKTGTSIDTLVLSGPNPQKSARALIHWNKKGIVFRIEVTDPLFYSDLSEKEMAQTGCEIIIDTSRAALPYPSTTTTAINVPLQGGPSRHTYEPDFASDGRYSLTMPTASWKFPVTIRTFISQGWVVECPVPWSEITHKVPAQIRCNIIVTLLSKDREPMLYSWVSGNELSFRAPSSFGVLVFNSRSIFGNPVVVWLLSFITGCMLSLAATIVLISRKRRRDPVVRFELTEEEKNRVTKIKTIIEGRLTDQSLTLQMVSEDLPEISARTIKRLLKKYTGQSFHAYLMRLRIEVARERLRSSNASEDAIARSCGFKSITEMEKVFNTCYHMTPYHFRMNQQVT